MNPIHRPGVPSPSPCLLPRLSAFVAAGVLMGCGTASSQQAACEDPAALLREYLDTRAAMDSFSGAFLLARGDSVLLEGAWGVADVARGEANRVGTRFNVGSMDKMLTAVAVAQLYEAGKVELDAPVGRYLPDYPDAEVREKATVRHLLTHTSGMGSYLGDAFFRSSRRVRTVRELMRFVEGRPLQFEPGARWSYSNSGFVVLGRIVEAASGEDWYAYVQRHVLDPAGMASTGFYDAPGEPAPGHATPYTRSRTGEGGVATPHPVRGGPAGGGYSTVRDWWRFARALQTGKLVRPATLELFTTGKVATGPEAGGGRYAFGFGEATMEGTAFWGHNGGAPGIGGNLTVAREGGWVISVLSNYGVPPMMAATDRARRAVVAANACRAGSSAD